MDASLDVLNVIGDMMPILGFCQEADGPVKKSSEAMRLGVHRRIDTHHENIDAVLNIIDKLLQVPRPDLVNTIYPISWEI